MSTKPRRIPPGPEQESVWDYPRPPRVEKVPEKVKIVFAGEVIAETTQAKRVLETSHPPTYYLPPEDVRMEYLTPTDRTSLCEWKGMARYFHIAVDGHQAPDAAWSYPDPRPGFESIQDHLAFYAGPMDVCYLGEEQVTPQPGGFYGGWITSRVVGPFKGKPGTAGW